MVLFTNSNGFMELFHNTGVLNIHDANIDILITKTINS